MRVWSLPKDLLDPIPLIFQQVVLIIGNKVGRTSLAILVCLGDNVFETVNSSSVVVVPWREVIVKADVVLHLVRGYVDFHMVFIFVFSPISSSSDMDDVSICLHSMKISDMV